MNDLRSFIRNNPFFVLVVGIVMAISVMVLITLTVTNVPDPDELPDPDDGITGSLDGEYDNSQVTQEGEPEETEGVDWNLGYKDFGALEFELPVNTEHYSISKLGEERYLVEINSNFPYSEQAVSIYLRQFNLTLSDSEIVVEYI